MINEEVLFSCVIPLYNKEDTIIRAINSVLNQSWQNFELIIVNDGSTDSSLKKVENISGTDSRIKIISQRNQGVSVARNTGIEISSGSLIALLDADDVWLSNHLSDIYQLYKLFPEVAAFSSNFKIMLKGGAEENSKIKGVDRSKENVRINNYCKSCVLSGGHLTGPINSSTAVLKKEIFQNIPGFKKGISNNEDLDLWLRISEQYDLAFTWKVSCKIDRTNIVNRKLKTYDYQDNYIIISGKKILENKSKKLSEKFWLKEYINKKKLAFSKNLIFHNRKKKALKVLLNTNTILFFLNRMFVLGLILLPINFIDYLRNVKNKNIK